MVGGELSLSGENRACAPRYCSQPREGQVNCSLVQAWPCVSFLIRLRTLCLLGTFYFLFFKQNAIEYLMCFLFSF